MNKVYFETEQKQADEELGRLLKALVVEPIDDQLGKRICGELFSVSDELGSKLKTQGRVLADVQKDVQKTLEKLEDLGEIKKEQVRANNQLHQLTADQQTTSQQLQSGFREQLQQLRSALNAKLSGLEQGLLGRTELLV